MYIPIIGGGIGGLCLAQGLQKRGITATVHDRDHTPQFRGQGWRVTIKEEGTRALRACLPDELFERCLSAAIRPATRMVFMNHELVPMFSKDIPPVDGHFGINRQALREILLTGLDIEFGHTFTHYDGPTAHFAGGATTTGDLLVGADGTGSAMRGQLLPDATLDDLGHCLYGVTPFAGGYPDDLVDTFNRVTHPSGVALAVATCRPGDYFTWTLSGLPYGWAELRAGADPLRAAREAVAAFHPGVRRLLAEATEAIPVRLRSARPYGPWNDPHVTLLGDAAHTMSPGRGDGANTALRDARLLATTLEEVASGRVPLGPAKALYEEEMLRYGFAAVEASRGNPFGPKTP
ncbi:FAD-dependent monooxygenase [Nonomuraea sp. NBC_01738]|uniref:FAD-dependent oxidoreductase n=1 Tax=Nonomuraea sp. NBC_01738 TaxID=2976003 RepID=UPI002E144F97|nr:FAD-dependent monooxygenase [Nonomuraea sp. NBC_01738]